MRTLNLFTICLLFSVAAFSQSDSTYLFALSSTGTYNQTNQVRTHLFNNQVRSRYKKGDMVLNGSCRWLYGKQSGQKTNDDISAFADLNLLTSMRHAYYWGLFSYNNILSLRINQQVQSGGGIAYNLVDKKKFQLNFSDGLIWEYSDVQVNDSLRDVYETFRNSFRIQVRTFFHDFSFRAAGYIQNSFEYKKDYIVKGEMNLSWKVKKWLSLTIQGNYNQMTRTRKETLFLTYGLNFEKYF